MNTDSKTLFGDAFAADLELDDEELLVTHWRFDQLVVHGYPEPDALALALNRTVDLHAARRLSRLGCPPELATRILG
jgi:hypothetical protein